MSNHSALPWSEYHGSDTHGWSILLDTEGCEIGSGDGGLEEDDAKLIVKAVNYHARLFEALQELLTAYEQLQNPQDGVAEDARIILKELGGKL